MQVAVIGAGIIGVTTAYELAADGHQVTVFERRSTVAAETSFANAGVIAPGYVTPWAAPGMPAKVLRQFFSAHAAVRLGCMPDARMIGWLWRWWQACEPALYQANRARMLRLARYSQQRLHALSNALRLDYEQRRGYLVLLRSPEELTLARPGLKLLAELGINFRLVDAARCHGIEPGLNQQTALHAGVHLPDDEVGNCRQFAYRVRSESQRLGVRFQFGETVLSLSPGARPALRRQRMPTQPGEPVQVLSEEFDAVVVCAALGAPSLLSPLGLALPLAPVHGYSLTAPLRLIEGHPEIGPQSALMDEKYKVAITRLGSRVRVAGSAELGGTVERYDSRALATLYKVLHDWYPGVAHLAQAQRWKGARPMLPDGPPVLGPSGLPGIWVNLGHGSSGWALSCGSARLVADQIAGREPQIDAEGLGIDRLRRAGHNRR
jgi:D-amino-acid dehydrogenase